VVEGGGEIRFGRYDNIDAFTKRIGDLEGVRLSNVGSDEGIRLSISFSHGVKVVIIGQIFFRVAPVIRVDVSL